MDKYNLSLPAETIDKLLLWLDDKQDVIIKQTDLLSGTGQSTTATMTQKAITDALGTKADASSVYTKTQTDDLLNAKADKSTTYTKSETDNLLNGKVDKVTGKGLSSNDYTDAEKAKLGALPTAAELSTDLAAKQDKDTDAVAGNVAVMNASGDSEDGGVPLSGLATKAEVAVVAGEAGLAEAVIDTDGAGTEQEFTFRKSGGDGGAYYRKIKGKTLAWNQLNPTRSSGTDHAVSFTQNSDGSVTVNGTASGSAEFYTINDAPFVPSGHKVLFLIGGNTVTRYTAYGVEYTAIGVSSLSSQIYTAPAAICYCELRVNNGETANNEKVFLNIVDLTQMFGAGNEPSTVAEFEALYSDIYPYNPGTLISNDAEAVETTGVNQWDEEWEPGTLNNTNGENYADGNWIRTKNYIPVIPGAEYYILIPATCRICAYDSNKNFISTFAEGRPSGLQTIPANARYIRLGFYAVTTYNYDICINLSNPAINGQYFPYWKRTLQLGITTKEDTNGNVPFPNGLQSCPVAQDEATKEGGTIRVGTRAYQAGDESDANVITDGTNTNYALATPVPFTWAEPLNLGVKVDENGTEKAVAPEGATAPSVPFVADTTYTMSVARMVEILKNL